MSGTSLQRAYTFVLDEALSILAVDDDPIQREFSVVYLTTPSAAVVTAASAADALTQLESRSFDIALIDFDMPGMNGIELVKQLRADPRHDAMPIMVITGREDMLSIDLAYEAGATGFMPKPVNWRLLSHQVKFLLRAHRAMQLQAKTLDEAAYA
jgi:DNA-binding response OmpR family regulator